MKEIIISNGIFKHNNKELEFIGIFEESRGYSIFYKDVNHITILEDGTDQLEPTYINPLRVYLEDSKGFITPTDEIENPFKFYSILTSGEIPKELNILNILARSIGEDIAPLLDIEVYKDGWSYREITLKDGTIHKEAYREQIITDEALTDLGLAFLTNVVGTIRTNKLQSRNILEELDQLQLEIVTPILRELELDELEELKANLVPRLLDGSKPTKTRKELASYLEKQHGIILRKDSGELYKRDKTGYSFISLDDIILLLSKDLGANVVSNKDLLEAITSISSRLVPVHNIVKFPNVVYDIENFKIIEPKEPIFSLVESKYDYNPKAESTILKEFLYSSLARETKEKTEETVKGLLQLIGYLFTSGNSLNILPILAGVSGGGKSVLTNILTNIFGKDKIADLGLQQMNKDPHGLASLSNKHLNFIRDSEGGIIEDNGNLKKLIGNEDIGVNPKYKPPYIIPKEEVPKTVLIANNIPRFRTKSDIVNKLVIIEFLVRFRGTDKENPNLEEEILANPQEMEWLIYQSIEAFKEVKQSKDFILKLDVEETLKLMDKHTNPISYLLGLVIEEHNPVKAQEMERPILTHELNRVLIKLAGVYGVDIELDKKRLIPARLLLTAIKREFSLEAGETVPITDSYGETKEVNRKYETRTIYYSDVFSDKTDYFREYPNLIANERYWKVLEELVNQ